MVSMNSINNITQVSAYKDIPQSHQDLSSDSLTSDSDDSEHNKNLVSLQLHTTPENDSREVTEKSKDYYFDKENDDYKNFLGLCQDLQDIEEE